MLYIQILSHSYWVLGSLLGALLSQFIPKSILGIEFALTALFIVLAQEHFYKKKNFTSIGLAFISAILALTISSAQFISIAMTLFVILLFIKQRVNAND